MRLGRRGAGPPLRVASLAASRSSPPDGMPARRRGDAASHAARGLARRRSPARSSSSGCATATLHDAELDSIAALRRRRARRRRAPAAAGSRRPIARLAGWPRSSCKTDQIRSAARVVLVSETPMLLPSYVAGGRWVSVVDKVDVSLISGAAAGDRDCLAALYDRYAPALLAIGRRILGDRREAEDLLHDVFIEVWRQAGDYDESRGSVRAWLLMRMRSRALDRRKAAVFSKRADLPAPDAIVDVRGDAARRRGSGARPRSPGGAARAGAAARPSSGRCSSSATSRGCRRRRSPSACARPSAPSSRAWPRRCPSCAPAGRGAAMSDDAVHTSTIASPICCSATSATASASRSRRTSPAARAAASELMHAADAFAALALALPAEAPPPALRARILDEVKPPRLAAMIDKVASLFDVTPQQGARAPRPASTIRRRGWTARSPGSWLLMSTTRGPQGSRAPSAASSRWPRA